MLTLCNYSTQQIKPCFYEFINHFPNSPLPQPDLQYKQSIPRLWLHQLVDSHPILPLTWAGPLHILPVNHVPHTSHQQSGPCDAAYFGFYLVLLVELAELVGQEVLVFSAPGELLARGKPGSGIGVWTTKEFNYFSHTFQYDSYA